MIVLAVKELKLDPRTFDIEVSFIINNYNCGKEWGNEKVIKKKIISIKYGETLISWTSKRKF